MTKITKMTKQCLNCEDLISDDVSKKNDELCNDCRKLMLKDGLGISVREWVHLFKRED